jgi:mono/diheme cytochrome c family protein
MARIVVLAGLAAAAGCNIGQAGKPDVARTDEQAAAQARTEQTIVERGKHLVETGGCHDCHTPLTMGEQGPQPDMSRALSGHPQDVKLGPPPQLTGGWMTVGSATNTAFAGPWGISYAINLTPDQDTGIGLWSEQVFVNALKTGRHMGVGRPIMPPMPWQAYSHLNDEDLRAMFAYLRSIEPRKNQVPEAVVNEPPAAPAAAPGAAPTPSQP